MKILVLTTEYPNSAEPKRSVFIREILVNFSRGAQIKIVAPVLWAPAFLNAKRSSIPIKEVIDGIEVFHPRYLIIPKVGRALYGFLYFLFVLPRMIAIKKTFSFDLIFGIWTYPDGFASVILGKIFKKPVAIRAMGCDINQYPKYLMLRKLIAFTLKGAVKIFAVSGEIKQKIVQLGVNEDKVVIVSNGIDQEKFYPMNKFSARQRLGIPLDKNIILFVGRLSEEKGLGYLIQSIAYLNESGISRALLFIIGEGRLKNTLKRRIKKLNLGSQISIVGSVEHSDIVYWINSSDVVCLPSLREGCPNVILEAVACGKPVVATRVGGIPEIITSENYGILVSPKNPADLAKGLQRALERRWDVEILRQKGASRTWGRVAQEILNEMHSAN